MKTLLLDTNIISYISIKHPIGDLYRSLIHGHEHSVSFMTIAEAHEGAYLANWGRHRIAILDMQLEKYKVLSVTRETCLRWAEIRAARKRQPISAQDAWIAATALEHACPLVTHNAKDFVDIAGLDMISVS